MRPWIKENLLGWAAVAGIIAMLWAASPAKLVVYDPTKPPPGTTPEIAAFVCGYVYGLNVMARRDDLIDGCRGILDASRRVYNLHDDEMMRRSDR